MKKIILTILSIFLIMGLTSCTDKENNNSNNISNESGELMNNISVVINDINYNILLEDNETVNKFLDKLPQTFEMHELNGNEKYVYLDYSLPTDQTNPKYIEAGDVMLYGDNCLVIFYKSFNTTYSYTKIGHIYDLLDLGKDNVTVTFNKKTPVYNSQNEESNDNKKVPHKKTRK